MNFFKKTPTVKEQQRDSDRILRKAGRDIERDRMALEREEKKVELEIKKMAKEGNNEACKLLAKQLVQLRKQKTRFYAANSKISSVGIQNKTMGANIALAGAMGTTAKTMGSMNKLMDPQKLAAQMGQFQKENTKMEMTDEMNAGRLVHYKGRWRLVRGVYPPGTAAHTISQRLDNIQPLDIVSDTLDDMLGDSDEESESNDIVNKVLDEIGIEISGKMAEAPTAIRGKIGEASSNTDAEIEAQLARLKS